MKILYFTSDTPNVKMRLSFESQSLKCGNTIILEAKIESCPSFPTVQWTHNQAVIRENARICFDYSDENNPKLLIHNANVEDNGNYLIAVTNILGSAEDQLHIIVKGLETKLFLFL